MEYYVGNLVCSSECYHHGIRGQKWGKRNGPPYPLGASDHSASEKKAEWRKSLNNSDKSISKNNNSVKSDKGKKIAKGILIGLGTVALGTAVFSAISSSGANYGMEIFDQKIYEKAVELSRTGSTIKTYTADGRVIIPYEQYGPLIHSITSNMTREMRKAKQFAYHYMGKVYMCENVKNDITRIVDWFDLENWEEAIWEVAHG